MGRTSYVCPLYMCCASDHASPFSGELALARCSPDLAADTCVACATKNHSGYERSIYVYMFGISESISRCSAAMGRRNWYPARDSSLFRSSYLPKDVLQGLATLVPSFLSLPISLLPFPFTLWHQLHYFSTAPTIRILTTSLLPFLSFLSLPLSVCFSPSIVPSLIVFSSSRVSFTIANVAVSFPFSKSRLSCA